MSVFVVIGGDSFVDLADEIMEETRPVVFELARSAGKILLSDVQRRLRRRVAASTNTKHGTPAPPGEPPAYQSGATYRSFSTLGVRVQDNVVTSGIKSSMPAEVNSLEHGHVTAAGTMVAPRAFLRPADESVQPEIDRLAATLL